MARTIRQRICIPRRNADTFPAGAARLRSLAAMAIPPPLDTDAEDVVWALQTAESLWKRDERADALTWVRRAAQAAGEAEDDDRALSLARAAAELTDDMSRHSGES